MGYCLDHVHASGKGIHTRWKMTRRHMRPLGGIRGQPTSGASAINGHASHPTTICLYYREPQPNEKSIVQSWEKLS